MQSDGKQFNSNILLTQINPMPELPITQRTETAVCRCSSKVMFLKISQYSQENTCVGVPS